MKDSSTDPEWNEQFLFDHVKLEDLRKNRVLELTVWNSTKNSKHYDFIGGLRLGPSPHHKKQLSYMDSSESELSHWMSVINTPGECVKQLQTLRHNMDPLPVTFSSPSFDTTDDNASENKNSNFTSLSTDGSLQEVAFREDLPLQNVPPQAEVEETALEQQLLQSTQQEVTSPPQNADTSLTPEPLITSTPADTAPISREDNNTDLYLVSVDMCKVCLCNYKEKLLNFPYVCLSTFL